jgi:hypothetical protein
MIGVFGGNGGLKNQNTKKWEVGGGVVGGEGGGGGTSLALSSVLWLRNDFWHQACEQPLLPPCKCIGCIKCQLGSSDALNVG